MIVRTPVVQKTSATRPVVIQLRNTAAADTMERERDQLDFGNRPNSWFSQLLACKPAVHAMSWNALHVRMSVVTNSAEIFFIKTVKTHFTVDGADVNATTFRSRTYSSSESTKPLDKVSFLLFF